MTEFGGEWIQAFPKDSWANVTNEYEPYTFNDYGSKIPAQELRPTTVDAANRTIVVDAENKTTMTVYMEMSVNGDYEMRYGNPQLVTTNDKWIAIEFKKSQLRVGSPASHAILTLLEAGESVGRTLLLTRTAFHALRGAEPLFHALFGVKTLSGTRLRPAFNELG